MTPSDARQICHSGGRFNGWPLGRILAEHPPDFAKLLQCKAIFGDERDALAVLADDPEVVEMLRNLRRQRRTAAQNRRRLSNWANR